MKQFQYLTQSYNLTFHDIYRILSKTYFLKSAGEFGSSPDYMQMRVTRLLPPTLLEQRRSQSKNHTGIIILWVKF